MNKLMMTTTSLLAGAALLFGGAVAANAATPAATPTATSTAGPTATSTATPTPTASSCTFGEHLVSAYLEIPKSMRADLKKARAEAPGAGRRADLKAIRVAALDGGYGAGVEAKAKFLKSHKGDAHIRPLPEALKADLKTLRGETGTAAKLAEADTIADRALAGGYGDAIESLAKAVKASDAWQDCTPAASTHGS